MRAVIYARESKGAAASRERQREDCERLCAQRGWKIVDSLGDDDKSAAGKRDRPDFDRLLKGVEAGEIEAIVAWSWDRLERNRRDTLRLIETCQPRGVNIALVRGSDIDMGTPAGRLSADILAGVARHEIDQKADRQARAGRQAAESGRPPKRRAFGYQADGMTIDPVEGPAVLDAFTRFVAGGSIAGITRSLNNAGHRTVSGKPWSNPAVRTLLRNGRYAAIRIYKRDEEAARGTWPAIVSEETWRAAVALLNDPDRRTAPSTARRWLGAAFYLCARCGSDMAVGYRQYGNYHRRVYRCRAHLGHLSRVADPIDEFVSAVVVARLRQPDVVELLSHQSPETAGLHDQARGLRARLDTVAADYADGLLTARQLSQATERLERRLAEVNRRLASAGRAGALASLIETPDPGAAWLALDVAARQAVARELITITVLPAPQGRKPFNPRSVQLEWKTA
jgi:site-specific DNA recombinase